MFPAIFAVLLLGHFVAAEIYVGQNPQNVNAVIKDANGNLIPVTGVADEIVVVDLNYGGEGNSSGMSVDVSVSPVNGSSSSSEGYPPPAYLSSISMPSGSSTTQSSSPPQSASPVSTPSSTSFPSTSATLLPQTWNSSSVAASNQSSISNPGSSSFASGSGSSPAGSASGLGLGLNIPMLPPMGTGISNPPSQPLAQSPVSEYDNLVSGLSESSSTKSRVTSPVSKLSKYYYPSISYPHVINTRSVQYNEYPQNSAPTTSFASQNFINSYPSAFQTTGYSYTPNQFPNSYPSSVEQTSFAHPSNTWASGYPNPSSSEWPVPGTQVGSSLELNFNFPTPASATWPSALSDYNSSPEGYPEAYVPSPSAIEPAINSATGSNPEIYVNPASSPLSEPPINPAVFETIVDRLIPASVIIPVFPQNGEEIYNYTVSENGTIVYTPIPPLNTPYTPYPSTFITPEPLSSSSSLPTQITPTIGNPSTFYNPFTTPQYSNPFTLPHTRPTPQLTSSHISNTSSGYPIGTSGPTSSEYTTVTGKPTSLGYTNGSGSSSGSGISGSGSGSVTPYNPFTTPLVIITSIETTSHRTETTNPFPIFNPFTYPTTPKPKTTTSSASGTANGSGYGITGTTAGSGTSNLFTIFNPFTFPTTHKPETTTKASHHGPSTSNPVTATVGGSFTGTGSGTGMGSGSSSTSNPVTATVGGSFTGTGSGTGMGSGSSSTGSGPSNPFTFFTTYNPKSTTKNHHSVGSSTVKPITTAFGGTMTGTGSGLSATASGPGNPFTFSTTHKPKTTAIPVTTAFGGTGSGSSATASGPGNPFTFSTTHKPKTTAIPVTTAFGGTSIDTGTGTTTGSGSSATGTASNNPFTFPTHKPKTTTKRNHHGEGPSTINPVTTSFGGTVTPINRGTGTASGSGTSTSTESGASGTGSESITPFTVFNPFTFSTAHRPKTTTTEKTHNGKGSSSFKPLTTAFGGTQTTTGTGSSTGSSLFNPFNLFTLPKTHHTKKPHKESNPINFFIPSTIVKPFTTASGSTFTGGSGVSSPTTSTPHEQSNPFNFFSQSTPPKHVTTALGGTTLGSGSTLVTTALGGTALGSGSTLVTTAFGGTATGTTTKKTPEQSNPFNFFLQSTTPKPVTTAFGGSAIGSSTGTSVTTAFEGSATGTGGASTKKPHHKQLSPFNFFSESNTQKPVTTAFGGTVTETTTKKSHEQSNPFNFFTQSTTPKSVTTAFGGTALGSGNAGTSVTTAFGGSAAETGSESTKEPSHKEFNPFSFFNPSSTLEQATTAYGGSKSSKGSKSENFPLNLFTLPTTPKSASTPSVTSSGFGDNGLGTGSSFQTATASVPKKSSKGFGGFNFFGNPNSNAATARSLKSKDSFNTPFNFFKPSSIIKSNSISKQNFSNPFSQSSGSKNKNSNLPNIFNFGGLGKRAQNKQSKNKFPAAPIFVELGGSLGPVVDPVNLTPVNTSNPFVSNVTSTYNKKNKNKNKPFFNMTNMMMNFSSPFQFPPNTNATPLNGILRSLFNSSTLKMQPVNGSFSPFGGMMQSFMNSGPSMFNPGNSNALPFSSLLNSSMNPSVMNSFFQNNPFLSNQSDGSSPQFSNMMNSIMNTTSSLFNMSTFSGASGSPFFNLSRLFSPQSLPFSNQSSSMNTSAVSNLINSYLGGNSSIFNFTSPSFMSSNSTNLKGILQNFLLPSMFGGSEGYDSDYPEDDIYKNLNSEFNDSDNDEDYYNPLQSLLPAKKPSGLSSVAGKFGSDVESSELPMIDGVENMMNNLLTPAANGTTPLTQLLDGVFGVNGSAPPSKNLFSFGGLLNPMTYMNKSLFNLTAALNNNKPFSDLQKIISSLKSTGLFGNISGTSLLTQNLTSLMTGDMNNNTQAMNNFIEIMNDIMSIWQDVVPIIQKFISNISSKPLATRSGQSAVPLTHSLPSAPWPMPRGIGTSFLALPTAPPAPMISEPLQLNGMQASAPAAEPAPGGAPSTEAASGSTSSTPVTSSTPQPPSNQSQSTQNGAPAPTPPINPNGTKTSPNAGISLSSTWITLIGCLFLALSQKSLLGLM